MKKAFLILSILFLIQCDDIKENNEQNKNAIVIITTKVKDGMMSDLVAFMDSENNIHVLLEEWDSIESHQKYVNYRMNEDETGAAQKHITFAAGGAEGLTIIGNNTNYIYY